MMETCMSQGPKCKGEVVVRFSARGAKMPRCEAHQAKRDKVEEHVRELESPTPPSDFDPSYAGERWDSGY